MALIRLNNQSLTNVTAAGLPTLAASNMPAGSVIQVANINYAGNVGTSSGTFAATGITKQITPLFNTSKILILLSIKARVYNNSGTDSRVDFRLSRDANSSFLFLSEIRSYDYGSSGHLVEQNAHTTFLDSPATTSPITYTVYWRLDAGTAAEINATGGSNISTLTLMEIAQ